MELPKNITQIGEVDKVCKVYVEDYVVSYIKQLNREAENREISVALYGRHEQEDGVDYHFIYGACRVEHLPKEVRHLSQAQLQEIERWRRKYFPDLAFAGYRLLDGEMIEGFHICDRDICRYIAGYACFYEKNEAMLAYMLDVRDNAPSEKVDQEKYARVRKRQEERRSAEADNADQTKAERRGRNVADAAVEKAAGVRDKLLQLSGSDEKLQRMRLAAVGVFALLCLFGIATFREDTAGQLYGEDAQAVNASVVPASVEKDTLVMEDKLEQALREENHTEEPESAPSESEAAVESAETATENTAEAVSESVAVSDGATAVAEKTVEEAPALPEAVAYVIQPGDTLIAISKRQYGTDERVADICARNKITDPDDIKKGQVIMLPR